MEETPIIPNVGALKWQICAFTEVSVQRWLQIRLFICGLPSNEGAISPPHSQLIKHWDHQSVVYKE